MRRPAISTSGSCRTAHWAGSSNVGSHPPGYQPVGFGDYNNDGTDDMLWFNPTTRDVDLWKISNGQWAGSVNIGTHPAGYQPTLSGDFNGDGTSDILWYNPTTRAVDIWKIDTNGQWAGSVDVGAHPAGYTPALAGDFNGDGTSDVLWYNPTTGHVDIWKLDRTANGRAASMSGPIRSDGSRWVPLISIWTAPAMSPGTIPRPTTSTSGSSRTASGRAASISARTWTDRAVRGKPGAPQPVVAVGVGDFDHNGVSRHHVARHRQRPYRQLVAGV